MRKTKIICTLGPTTETIIEQLIINGMDTARINQSHETHEIHTRRINQLKKMREKLNKPIALLMDTKGPEIRTGVLEEPIELKQGQEFRLVCNDITEDQHGVSITHTELYNRVNSTNIIYIDDGRIKLKVERIENKDIVCTVLSGGVLSNRKSINIPNCETGLPFLNNKDEKDIQFAIEHEFDYIALSFVRNSQDVNLVRDILNKSNSEEIKIIAKIENRTAIDNIDDIIEASDGIMIARGDLGVEIPLEQVPIIQKELIKKCYLKGKPVITATQMLETMVENPLPTRAEISDIANAIYDSTSAVMLSGETAAGKYPIEALKMMAKIVEATENDIDYKKKFYKEDRLLVKNIVNIIGQATTVAAFELGTKAIIVITNSGNSARMISRFRTECPIIAITVNPRVERQLNMSWGIYPVRTDYIADTLDLFNNSIECAKKTNIVGDGDLVILTAGLPTGTTGKTNMLKIHKIGEDVL